MLNLRFTKGFLDYPTYGAATDIKCTLEVRCPGGHVSKIDWSVTSATLYALSSAEAALTTAPGHGSLLQGMFTVGHLSEIPDLIASSGITTAAVEAAIHTAGTIHDVLTHAALAGFVSAVPEWVILRGVIKTLCEPLVSSTTFKLAFKSVHDVATPMSPQSGMPPGLTAPGSSEWFKGPNIFDAGLIPASKFDPNTGKLKHPVVSVGLPPWLAAPGYPVIFDFEARKCRLVGIGSMPGWEAHVVNHVDPVAGKCHSELRLWVTLGPANVSATSLPLVGFQTVNAADAVNLLAKFVMEGPVADVAGHSKKGIMLSTVMGQKWVSLLFEALAALITPEPEVPGFDIVGASPDYTKMPFIGFPGSLPDSLGAYVGGPPGPLVQLHSFTEAGNALKKEAELASARIGMVYPANFGEHKEWPAWKAAVEKLTHDFEGVAVQVVKDKLHVWLHIKDVNFTSIAQMESLVVMWPGLETPKLFFQLGINYDPPWPSAAEMDAEISAVINGIADKGIKVDFSADMGEMTAAILKATGIPSSYFLLDENPTYIKTMVQQLQKEKQANTELMLKNAKEWMKGIGQPLFTGDAGGVHPPLKVGPFTDYLFPVIKAGFPKTHLGLNTQNLPKVQPSPWRTRMLEKAATQWLKETGEKAPGYKRTLELTNADTQEVGTFRCWPVAAVSQVAWSATDSEWLSEVHLHVEPVTGPKLKGSSHAIIKKTPKKDLLGE